MYPKARQIKRLKLILILNSLWWSICSDSSDFITAIHRKVEPFRSHEAELYYKIQLL